MEHLSKGVIKMGTKTELGRAPLLMLIPTHFSLNIEKKIPYKNCDEKLWSMVSLYVLGLAQLRMVSVCISA